MNNSLYKLGIIELFFPNRHTKELNTKEHYLNGHYICTTPISINNFYNEKFALLIKNAYKLLYEDYINHELNNHYFHKNFKNIVQNDNYFNIKIIKIIYINNLKIIIDKTFFLKILQRKWKKYFYRNYIKFLNNFGCNQQYYNSDESDDSGLTLSDAS